jgi:hypothetical protein
MRKDLNQIEAHLHNLGVPPAWVLSHVRRVERWRVTHPPKSLKRHRLYSPDDEDARKTPTRLRIAKGRKRKYRGARAVFRKG